jgi:hypothetical protein
MSLQRDMAITAVVTATRTLIGSVLNGANLAMNNDQRICARY